MTLSAEEHRHPLTPHLVVFAIEVWRTRTPSLVCHPWILDWLGSIETHNRLCYHLKDRGEPERRSEWESIKILLEGDKGSKKMNTTSNTCLRLTTQVVQDHAATRVLLALGTNNQLHGPENAAEHQLEPHLPTSVRLVSTTG
jgi:hypothetical protein